ncbi:MAG: LacI family DNA-binding transcriptional regulator [Marinoscillum sp.]
MGKYVTMTELAKKLGLSHSTVSRALKNHPAISLETTEKVKNLAEQLGYQSNFSANQLSHGKSKLIGVIVPDLTINFYTKVIEGIQNVLESEDYATMLFNTKESFQREEVSIETCLKYRVDGVLAAISMETKHFHHFEKLLKYEVPLVFFDRVANFLAVPKIITNDHQAAFNATNHLIETGCKKIAHITASINLNNSNNRLYGYLDALKASNLDIDESLIHYYESKLNSISNFLKKTIAQHPDMDGLFVFNDYVANYSVNILQGLGKRIPEDIAVFGFSDEPVATHMTPQLSTVHQNGQKMGQFASQKLCSILKKNEPMSNEKITINPKLILRESTR